MTTPLSQARSKIRRAGSAPAGSGVLRSFVGHQFDRGQHAATTYIADQRVIGPRMKTFHQALSGLPAVVQQALLVEAQALERDRRAHGMGGISVAMTTSALPASSAIVL